MRHEIVLVTRSNELANQIKLFAGGHYNLRRVAIKRDALETLARERPNVCIVDESSPNINGYDICATVKDDFRMPYICFLLLLDNVEQFDSERSRLSSIDGYLVKPLQKKDFNKLLHELCNKSTQYKGYFSNKKKSIESRLETTLPAKDLENDNPFTSSPFEFQESIKDRRVSFDGFTPAPLSLVGNLPVPVPDESEPMKENASPSLDDSDMDSSSNDERPSDIYHDPVEAFLDSSSFQTDQENMEDKLSVSSSAAKHKLPIADLDAVSMAITLNRKQLQDIMAELIKESRSSKDEDQIRLTVSSIMRENLPQILSDISPKIIRIVRQAVKNELNKQLQPVLEKKLAPFADDDQGN